jgi:hypothetical protein
VADSVTSVERIFPCSPFSACANSAIFFRAGANNGATLR